MARLTISRSTGERLRIRTADGDIWITVRTFDNRPGRVKLTVETPRRITISREELLPDDEAYLNVCNRLEQ
jgi:sRNA-binding carbon storage regulator CsrA